MNLTNFLMFFHSINKLKSEFRHAWTSLNRKESVAEHSWRVSFMVMLLANYLNTPINLEKALKMSIVHDIAEIKTGDIHLFEFLNSSELQNKKFEKEQLAIQELLSTLPIESQQELYGLWLEFEKQISNEAKLVLAIDKLEAHIQHNEANLSTWTEDELKSICNGYLDKYCDFNDCLKELKELILLESQKKINSTF